MSAAPDIRTAARAIRNDDVRSTLLGLADSGWRAVRYTGKCLLLIEHEESGARITACATASDRHAARILRRMAKNAIARSGAQKS